MFFTLFISALLAQAMNPSIADFSDQASLSQALLRNQITVEAPTRLHPDNLGPIVTSRSAVVIDKDSRKILWGKDIHKRYPIASLSKLMTVLVFLDTQPDLTDTITLQETDMTVGGRIHIAEGETVTYRNLLHSALIASDNNAAQAVVRASGLPRDEFIRRMNQKAQDLGMLNSRFVEPTGLEYSNISSAQDITLLLEEALKNQFIASIVAKKEYSFVSVSGVAHDLINTNELLGSYLTVIGGKTGFNNEALYNLVVAIENEEGHVVLVGVLGSEDINARFQDAKVVADWAFNNYEWREKTEKIK